MDIGKSILKASTRTSEDGSAALGDAKKAQESVVWLQRAFTLMEKMEDSENAGVLELRVGILLLFLRSRLTLWPKRAILRSLGMCFTVRFELLMIDQLQVRAYYLSSSIETENLIRAETTLQELIGSIDNSTDSVFIRSQFL